MKKSSNAHLLSSKKNKQRLLTALNRALEKKVKPKSINELRIEVGLETKRPSKSLKP